MGQAESVVFEDKQAARGELCDLRGEMSQRVHAESLAHPCYGQSVAKAQAQHHRLAERAVRVQTFRLHDEVGPGGDFLDITGGQALALPAAACEIGDRARSETEILLVPPIDLIM